MMTSSLGLIFTKKGLIRYVSHLDLIRLFARGVRRAGLPVKVSEGFNPKYVFSIKQALKLGVESDHEEVVFSLAHAIEPDEFKSRLQEQMPEGIIFSQGNLEKK